MTMQQAIQARLSIEPGRRVKTFGGWCRRDRVLLDGHEIGKIQTRRAPGRTEILTIGASGFVPGHDVDWLVANAGEELRDQIAARADRSRRVFGARISQLRRSVG